MSTIEKITERLKLVFDEVAVMENNEGLTFTIKNKGKVKLFKYAKNTYEVPFNQYNEGNRGVEMQCAGMIADCLDEWGVHNC